MTIRCFVVFFCLSLMVLPIPIGWTQDLPSHSEIYASGLGIPNATWVSGVDLDQDSPVPPLIDPSSFVDIMPYPPTDAAAYAPRSEPQMVVSYDAITRTTRLFPLPKSSPELPMSGGGYLGTAAGFGEEPIWKSFGNMTQRTDTEDHPWRMNVRLLMRFLDSAGVGDRWAVCSGTMQDAEVVQTAGHCVYSHDSTMPGWAQEVWVFPAWDGIGDQDNRPVEPYGFAHSTDYWSFTGWTSSGNRDDDRALIQLDRGVGMLTGWFGWAWGGDCATIMDRTYNNASYPAENCPLTGLHTGLDMYFWSGSVDSCPGNQVKLNTGGGNCFDTAWGGMSGSGMYYQSGSSRYTHAVASTSDRNTEALYCVMTEDWVNYMNGVIIPMARGITFDLQALDFRAEPTSIVAGSPLSVANVLSANPTNGSASGTWSFDVRLSGNDNISSGDTLLSTASYFYDYSGMSSTRVHITPPTIPVDTPTGTYWIGALWSASTDSNYDNNDTDNWDAQQISVLGVTDLHADHIYAPTGIYASGETFPVSYQVSNLGADPSMTITVEVRASTNTLITTSDQLLATFVHSGIPGKGSVNNMPSVSFPLSLPNRLYYIGMIASSADDVNSGNNTDHDIVPLMKFDGLFYDGFEGGDTSRWSKVVP